MTGYGDYYVPLERDVFSDVLVLSERAGLLPTEFMTLAVEQKIAAMKDDEHNKAQKAAMEAFWAIIETKRVHETRERTDHGCDNSSQSKAGIRYSQRQ